MAVIVSIGPITEVGLSGWVVCMYPGGAGGRRKEIESDKFDGCGCWCVSDFAIWRGHVMSSMDKIDTKLNLNQVHHHHYHVNVQLVRGWTGILNQKASGAGKITVGKTTTIDAMVKTANLRIT